MTSTFGIYKFPGVKDWQLDTHSFLGHKDSSKTTSDGSVDDKEKLSQRKPLKLVYEQYKAMSDLIVMYLRREEAKAEGNNSDIILS